MRVVQWTDHGGYLHRSLVRDTDPDDRAPKIGILLDPPDLSRLDCWQELEQMGVDVPEFKKRLHNKLVQFGLVTWADVQKSQNGITSAIMSAGRDRKILRIVKRPLIMLYKLEV